MGKEYFASKGKWELVEAPSDGKCGYFCRAYIANAPDMQDHLTWGSIFQGELLHQFQGYLSFGTWLEHDIFFRHAIDLASLGWPSNFIMITLMLQTNLTARGLPSLPR